MDFLQLFGSSVNENTVGGLILAAFFTMLGILLRGVITNHGSIRVAQINSETTLGTKAIETLTTALEVLQEENKSLKASMKQLESHIDTLIEHILVLVKATTQEEVARATGRLEQYLKAIGRWPY